MSEAGQRIRYLMHLEPIPVRAVLFGVAYFACATVANLLALKPGPSVNLWMNGAISP